MTVMTHYSVLAIPAALKNAANGVAHTISEYGDQGDCFPVPLSATGAEPWTHWLGCPAVGPLTVAALPGLRAAFPGSAGYETPIGQFDSAAVDPWLDGLGLVRMVSD